LRAPDLDLIVVSRPHVAAKVLPIARKHAPGVPVAYDMVDLHALRHDRGSKVTKTGQSRYERRMSAWESQALADAGHIIAVNQGEANLVRSMRPDVAVSVLGNVHELRVSATSFAERAGLLFVGSWSHAPNQDAVQWLLAEVMPDVWEMSPKIELHLVGSGLPKSFGADQALVHNHGWCADLAPLFDSVLLSIAPLRFGAGTKGKVGDSLARGVPVVGTAIAAEGFDASIPGLGDVETAAEIAEAVRSLRTDEATWTQARLDGIALIENHFTALAAKRAIEQMMSEAAPR